MPCSFVLNPMNVAATKKHRRHNNKGAQSTWNAQFAFLNLLAHRIPFILSLLCLLVAIQSD